MAPSFANLFMGKLGTDFLKAWGSDKQPLLWLRFTNDMFFLWQHGEIALKEFMTFINNFHNTIQFEHISSPKQINFLDTTIFFNSIGKLESKLYDCSTLSPLIKQCHFHKILFTLRECKTPALGQIHHNGHFLNCPCT